MGLEQPRRSTYYDLPTPPPSTPLSLPPLPPLASTVNIHITNHNHYSIQTPPDSAKYNFGPKDRTYWKSSETTTTSTTTTSQKVQYKSPLLQRLIQGLSPVYGYLTPAATPLRRTSTVTSVEESPLVKQSSQAEQTTEERQEVEDTVFRDIEPSTPQDMPYPAQIRFSASAGNRDFAPRTHEHGILSSPPTLPASDDVALSEDSLADVVAVRKSTKRKTTRAEQKKNKRKQSRVIPACYNHDLRLPEIEPGVDVVPCDWIRPFNSSTWNNFTNGDVQCKVPKCDVCISHETYGEKSIWALSAPEGHTAESHRLRSRIRYLCSRCPQPAPPPPGGIGPIEMCTCVLRDGQGIPTDMWFQCKECAESAWFEHDSKYGGPDGVFMTRRAMRRKNKYGIVVRPRMSKAVRQKKGWRVKRCVCGKIAPRDGKYGAWCTWCQLPVAGSEMMELGGAATNSGRAFLPKNEEEDEGEEGVAEKVTGEPDEAMDVDEDKKDEREDEEMTDDGDCDSGIVVFE
ncbi:hypothetical protein TWF281_004507 [Arthrobotrys megalospora]